MAIDTYAKKCISGKYFCITILAIASVFYMQPVFSQHPICDTHISGVSLNDSTSEIENKWKTQGLNDITCTRRMKMSCESKRQQVIEYASNTSGFLENLEDKILTASINSQKKITTLTMKMRINAPETLQAYDANRSWKGWSHASLIESKIAKFCKTPTPKGLIIQCDYRSGVKITVIVGSPMNKECQYNFEARFRGKYGPTPPDHAIHESLYIVSRQQ